MKTTKDVLSMCVNEYYLQLKKWYNWDNIAQALFMPVLAFDYIARGDY